MCPSPGAFRSHEAGCSRLLLCWSTGLGRRPQGSPFMILAWAAPHLQETPPFQLEECRLHHFRLPACTAGGSWQADP